MNGPVLERIKLCEGRQVTVSALAIEGRSEIYEFLRQTLSAGDNLYTHFRNMMLYCSDNFHHAPASWLRAIRGWQGLWELRKGDHRLIGFLHGTNLILCLHRIKRGPVLPRQDFERVERLRQEWIKQDG